jgi:hypothetical protein
MSDSTSAVVFLSNPKRSEYLEAVREICTEHGWNGHLDLVGR